MENKVFIDNAKTVFEKKDDKYFGYKSRLGDIIIGGAYSYGFVVHYAKTNEDVVIIPGDVNTVTTPVCTRQEDRLWKPEKSAQTRRNEIIEQAKADIENLKANDGRSGEYTFDGLSVNAAYTVNSTKRTIVVLLRGARSGTVYARGIAKAAPSDCFNVHIGRAIALRRALGLVVPDEYLNAPQPTEVRVGDVVSNPVGSATGGVLSDDARPPLTGRWVRLKNARKYGFKIIDDSHEEVSYDRRS
ncbi:hypothetical protein [Bacillus atrophaeus]|uniref:hypothetical protein n=1 Tax=Bacillus atrophaeus TaxID=1452 RepID=UPI002281238E|nr:hypothetical protein [Bacillus atrophaeus]MCY8958285.1 hypothetical protein [Bacillus atrophaeus]MCY8963858.1 hypothetical protein [Bacillus atrophaeus]MCY9440122.1 hypothetical protein [Bacillus atrophaeus]MEC0648401.1 hypothetical protein [Bacillus atrophaeus]